MLRKFSSLFLFVSFLSFSAMPGFAKAIGTWNDVKSLIDQEIAVKNSRGRVTYGILRKADDSMITLQKAGKKSLTNANSSFPKNDVRKVWRASLYVDKRRTAIGAAIGAGAGLGGGLIYVNSDSAAGDGQAGIAAAYLIVIGAGVGALAGYFSKKKHKKTELVYKK